MRNLPAARSAPIARTAAWLVLAALAACGQKGPLYLPGHSKDTPWPTRTSEARPQPAPTPPDDKTAAAPATGTAGNGGAQPGAASTGQEHP